MESTSAMESFQSPFAIPHEDVEALCASDGFQLLRSCLAKDAEYVTASPSLEKQLFLDIRAQADHTPRFCISHSESDVQAQQTWLLHRDLLHALIMPVVELFKGAETLAAAALCTRKSEDLELAFSGEARSAFLWLQCFVAEEIEWCQTKGCPACVTTATLSTESHIRLTIAASLLSTASVAAPNSSPAASTTSSPAESPIAEEPEELISPSLPPLPHILPALREALSADPFWGPDYWSHLFSRASQLSGGIQALITSCIDLQSLVSSPTSETPPSSYLTGSEASEEKGVKLRKSKLAKRQLRMKGEAQDLLRRCALQCWAQAAVPSKLRGEVLGLGKEKRERSLTCP